MSESSDFSELSASILKLAGTRQAVGNNNSHDALIRIAANLELESAELQQCWGGALNGQEGRRRLFQEILQKVECSTLIETGTFRGITTAWFAENFSGPIYSCEKEPLYFYQAQENLKNYPSVRLWKSDSREFLKSKIYEIKGGAFFYLDAHWEDDLPLKEEIEIIFRNIDCKSVIAIDDFKVPGDDYHYDDYGPGRELSVELLHFLHGTPCRIYFPKLKAVHETGAVRGVCVITSSQISALDECVGLVGGSWEFWNEYQLTHEAQARQATAKKDFKEAKQKDMECSEMTQQENMEKGVENESAINASLQEMQGSLHAYAEAARALLAESQEINKSVELGRELVEQRAYVLQLERQNYILRDELESARSKPTKFHQATNEEMGLEEVEGLLHGLNRSRALKVLSLIAPSPRRDVESMLRAISALRNDVY